MNRHIITGLLIPFIGTSAGSGCVFFMKHSLSKQVQRALTGFAAGVMTAGGAFALALGIAIQNFPEGAIISMPLHAEGKSKGKAFADGVLSGAVEPTGAALTILFAGLLLPAMPYLLSFAAGAMIYVVVEELIPEMSEGEHSNIGVIMFSVGFTLMMILDVALG